jgi:hypothetical protein
MAKESGIGVTVTVDDSGGTGRDISNDVGSLQFATPRGVQDVTGVDSAANERLQLLADFSITLTGAAFNDAANLSHAVFSTVPSTSVARTTALAHSGNTLSCETLYSDYQLSRSQAGELTWSAPGALSDGSVPTWA